MARLEASNDAVQLVARGIGKLIDMNQPPSPDPEAFNMNVSEAALVGERSATRQGTLTIGETLTVWKLTSAAFQALRTEKLSGDLVKWVEPTPFLHHQIKLDGKPQGIARSFIGQEGEPVLSVDASPFAAKLGSALNRIDDPAVVVNHERDDGFFAADPVVRLLSIPACRIFALWLFVEPDQSRVMIVNAMDPRSEYEYERVLNSEEFYQALSIYRPLDGVG